MAQAFVLARQGEGRTLPNPSVGCVIVKDSVVVGAARTADGGRSHAETQALNQAGHKARSATVYVTLEPCNTHGKTGPCVEALVKADVARVVIAHRDPSQVDARGIETLRVAGILVDITKTYHRPFVAAKIATTLDGRIATATGESRWITGEESRHRVHQLRAASDAVVVGINTVLADDPLLNVRLPDCPAKPVRIVIDRSLKIPLSCQLVSTAADHPVMVVTCSDSAPDKAKALRDKDVDILPVSSDHVLPDMMKGLSEKGIRNLLVEGGGYTLTAFLKQKLIDRLYWFRAPKLIGSTGIPAFYDLGINKMSEVISMELEASEKIGPDILETWRCFDEISA